MSRQLFSVISLNSRNYDISLLEHPYLKHSGNLHLDLYLILKKVCRDTGFAKWTKEYYHSWVTPFNTFVGIFQRSILISIDNVSIIVNDDTFKLFNVPLEQRKIFLTDFILMVQSFFKYFNIKLSFKTGIVEQEIKLLSKLNDFHQTLKSHHYPNVFTHKKLDKLSVLLPCFYLYEHNVYIYLSTFPDVPAHHIFLSEPRNQININFLEYESKFHLSALLDKIQGKILYSLYASDSEEVNIDEVWENADEINKITLINSQEAYSHFRLADIKATFFTNYKGWHVKYVNEKRHIRFGQEIDQLILSLYRQ